MWGRGTNQLTSQPRRSHLREKLHAARPGAWLCCLAFLLAFAWPRLAQAYSVLSHEAIIDSTWDTNLRPLLLKRFPQATPEELKEAHGYAYGGRVNLAACGLPAGACFCIDT